jgi:hypothetical protein
LLNHEQAGGILSERRTTITRSWRPAGAPARRHDDFVEVAFAAPAPEPEPPAVDRGAIVQRLENWGRWCRSSDGALAAASMTGAICESMLRAAGGGEPRAAGAGPSINSDDAAQVGRAMVKVTFDQRRLLGRLYVDEARKGLIAAMLRIPPLEFDKHLAAAQDAIEAVLSASQNSNSK